MDHRVFTLLGDGELAEGSSWEALMSASHYKLDNLVIIVDRNTLQITGGTEDVMGLEPLADRFVAFGCAVRVCNGNDVEDLVKTLDSVPFEAGQPNLVVFAETLLELAKQDASIMVLTSDSRGSGKLVPYGQELPDQIVEMGIAEQNLVGVSAGLAMTGKKVFAVSPACFLTARSLEQIKNDIAYSDHPVKLIGISAGVSYGTLGSTHHSTHDFAVLRAINNVDIVAPVDNFETRGAIKAAVDYPRPIYIRYGKKPMLDLHFPDTTFEIGKAITLMDGEDVTFIATGEPTERALLTGRQLQSQGISYRVISMHTVKPLDVDVLLDAAQHTRVLITVE